METLAHVRQSTGGSWAEHPLRDHLESVGRLAAEFAKGFGGDDWANLAGLWHDLGKYSAEFQRYIRTATGYEREEAHIEGNVGRVDHSTAGALHAVNEFGRQGRVLAYLIAGHHAGLPDWHPDEQSGPLALRLQQKELLTRALAGGVPMDILKQRQPAGRCPGGVESFALWVRMLFSCLVDADFLDTEAFMNGARFASRKASPQIQELLTLFDNYMARKFSRTEPTLVNRLRTEVLNECRKKAIEPPGIFSLSVPTGGGKTLSSLAFALSHAAQHGKRRVIYAIPYTSIIEQTANIFREVFGDLVVEHHSNLDAEVETAQSRLAAENWDAALIVTTNVQLFESLFASRTSRARKLHNIVNSVIVLDEAQLVEPAYLQPILDCLSLLVKYYGVTVVLATATQPAFAPRVSFGGSFRPLERVKEIIADPDGLYRSLHRVNVTIPTDFQACNTWDQIAARLQEQARVLCIVNRRKDCRELFRKMPAGGFHLSGLMCGQHRSDKLAMIQERLRSSEAVRVVSTQLVEAGVDVDFPVVYRAMAGLDSIAQAAGRCNREGRLERGEVVVFVPPTQPPPGILKKAEQVAISLLSENHEDPLDRMRFTRFFERLYGSTDLDKDQIVRLLTPDDGLQVQFRTAAARFRMIDDSAYRAVFVPYKDSPALIGKLASNGPERWLMRKLQRYTVNLSKTHFNEMLARGDVKPLWKDSFFSLVSGALYDDDVGVLLPDEELAPEDFVV